MIWTWVKEVQGQLDDTDIDHEIHKHMKRFMTDSSFFKPPNHHEKPTNIHLWKQFRQPYFNSRTDEWICPFRCPMAKPCACVRPKFGYALVIITSGSNLLEIIMSKVTQMTRARNSSKVKQIIAIQDEVIVRAYGSGLF
jgi:hypothetical protein